MADAPPLSDDELEDDMPSVQTMYELHDDEARNTRSMQDAPCLIIFYAVMSVVVYIIALSFTYGEPTALPSVVEHELNDAMTTEMAMLRHDNVYIFSAFMLSMLLVLLWFQIVRRASFFLVYGMVAASVLLSTLLGLYLYRLSRTFASTELLIIAVGCWLGAVLICGVGYTMRSKLEFTIKIMHEAGKQISALPEVYGVGLVFLILFILLFAIWVTSMIYLFSVPTESYVVLNASGTIGYVFDSAYRNFFWILFFGGLWLFAVLEFAEQYIIASLVFQRLELAAKLRIRSSPILRRAVYEALTTSFGSLALGSFLTAITWFFGLLGRWDFFTHRIAWRQYFVLRVIGDIIGFLLEWISEFAVINVALTGQSFLRATREVANMLKTEFSQFVVTNLIVSYILLLGKLAGTAFVALVTIWLIEYRHYHVGVVSLLVTLVGAFLLFNLASKIYIVCVNTLLIYTIRDLATNKATGAFKSPESLRTILLVESINQ